MVGIGVYCTMYFFLKMYNQGKNVMLNLISIYLNSILGIMFFPEINEKMKKLILILPVLLGLFSSCENGDWEFEDFDYQTVYFAYQSPVRTITLGEDYFDNSLDNEHKFKIMATTGGVYENSGDIVIDFIVDDALCNNLAFEGGGDVLPMPAEYYSIVEDNIVIPSGELAGGVEVQLTDAFFDDPLALSNNYVIPVQMTSVTNADSILSGVPMVDNPQRGVSEDWDVAPKDYVFYAVKYINEYDGEYLRRGEDVVVGLNGNSALDTTIVRQEEYVVEDEVVSLGTKSLTQVEMKSTVMNGNGENIDYTILLTFNEEGNCTVSTEAENYTVSGSGSFVKDGEKNSWGGEDRDAVYLDYQIEFSDMTVSVTDTLVLRDRGVGMETFATVLK